MERDADVIYTAVRTQLTEHVVQTCVIYCRANWPERVDRRPVKIYGQKRPRGGGPLAVSLTDPVYFVALAFCSLKVSTAFFLHLIPKKAELLQIHYL